MKSIKASIWILITGALGAIFEGAMAFLMRNMHKVQAGRGINAPGTPEIPPSN